MSNKQIITIKIGSSTLLTDRQTVDEYRVGQFAAQIKQLHKANWKITLVVSGAVACGSRCLKTEDLLSKQAAAGIGQALLISKLIEVFRTQNLNIAQILVTKPDIKGLSGVVNTYFENNIVPIFNENDVVSLNDFGGNDFLALEVAKLTHSSRLLILSTMIRSKFGVGGGEAKQQALSLAKKQGILTQIVDGKARNILIETLL